MNQTFSELFQESLKTLDLIPGKAITGVVMAVDKDWVTVHAGLKSEGIIPLEQFLLDPKNPEPPKEGDRVSVILETVDDGLGNTCLSREKALRFEAWQKLEEAFVNETNIVGTITLKVKGGFMVDIDVLKCFLPGSLVDERPLTDTSHLEGKELEFRVIRLERKRNNVVLSRRAVLENYTNAERENLLASLVQGQTVTGKVKNLTDYGAFVDIGGLDGLLHVTDMSWKRINSPGDVVAIGDEIKVLITRLDKENKRISLSLKELEEDPWEYLKKKYQPGSTWTTKVINLVNYGFFVELDDGISGLIHISEIDWLNSNIRPSDKVSVGQEVEVSVLEVDTERHRISLSLKRCTANPWEEFQQKQKVGDRIKGTVNSVTDFGLFVTLDSGITGLVHSNDISWEEKPGNEADLLKNFAKGDEVETVLLSIDVERERAALSIRQVDDPLAEYLENNPVGSQVTGKITKVLKHSASIELGPNVIGLLQSSESGAKGDIDTMKELYNPGDEVTAVMLEVNYKLRRIYLSVKSLTNAETRQALEDYQQINTSNQPKLGDLIGKKNSPDN